MADATLWGWIAMWKREDDGATDHPDASVLCPLTQVMKMFDFTDLSGAQHLLSDLCHVCFAMWFRPVIDSWVY